MNIYLCEDNKTFREKIKNKIMSAVRELDIKIDEFILTDDPEEIISRYQNTENNIYFLDIELRGDSNGLVLAKEIRKHDFEGEIIFITSHLELSLKVFEYKLKVLDYIYKGDDITDAIYKNLDIIKREQEKKIAKGKIALKVGNNLHSIRNKDILYFETSTNTRKVNLVTKDSLLELSETLSSIEQKLDNNFIRCHRAYIININRIKTLEKKIGTFFAVMENGERCVITKKKFAEVKKKLGYFS